MKKSMLKIKLVAIMFLFHLLASTSHASIIININQVGGDIVATGSGSINLTGLTLNGDGWSTGQFAPYWGRVAIGSTFARFDIYGAISGPTAFSPYNVLVNADLASGNFFGVDGSSNSLFLPFGYTSGTQLSGTSTWQNTSLLNDLGINTGPSTYSWQWGSGANLDSFTVNFNSGGGGGGGAVATPEPGTMMLLGSGVLTFGLSRFRRRKPEVVA